MSNIREFDFNRRSLRKRLDMSNRSQRDVEQEEVEHDLYEGLGVKQDAVLLCAAMTAAL
jgi:hypothetical protein